MVVVVIFCSSCPECDEQETRFRRGVVSNQLHQNETVLVKTRSAAAADMEKVHVTNKLANKQT